MRFGLAYVSYVYNEERIGIAQKSLDSLARTNTTGLEIPVLRFTYHPSDFDYAPYFDQLRHKFELEIYTDPPECKTFDIIIQDAGLKILRTHPDVSHVGFMCDDSLCNPEWLQQLMGLVGRRPD